MNATNQFSQYYKTASNTELLAILDNMNDYQPLAVEAASKEYDDRKLSELEIQEARQVLIEKLVRKDIQLKKIRTVENKIRTTGSSFLETLNPIQYGIPSTEKTIRFISVVFAGIFIYQCITNFTSYLIYVKEIFRSPLESLLFILPEILLFIAVITFWKRKTYGWILLTAFLSLSAFATIIILVQSLKWKPSEIEFGQFEYLFPGPSPLSSIMQSIFLLGSVYVLCKPNIRHVYSINNKKMVATLFFSILVSFILMFSASQI